MSTLESVVRFVANDMNRWVGLQMCASNLFLNSLEPYLNPTNESINLEEFKGDFPNGDYVFAEVALADYSEHKEEHPFPELIGKEVEEHPYYRLIEHLVGLRVPVFVCTDYEPIPKIDGAVFHRVGDDEVRKMKKELLKSSVDPDKYEAMKTEWIDYVEQNYKRITAITAEELLRPFTI